MLFRLARNVLRITHNDKIQNKFVAHCASSVKLGKILIFSLVLVTSCFSRLCMADAPVMKTLSAHVVQVAADNASLEVDFRHPATGEVRRMTFYVDNQTGLSGIDTLQELRAGQIVNIDYVEGEKHRLLIRRIARVKLSGPPAGLEKFHGL